MTDLLSLFKHWSNLETMMSCWWAGDDKEKYGYYTPSGLKASIHQPQRQIEKKLHMQKHFTHKMNFSKEFFFKNWIFQWSGKPPIFWHETTNFLQIFQTCNLQFSHCYLSTIYRIITLQNFPEANSRFSICTLLS